MIVYIRLVQYSLLRISIGEYKAYKGGVRLEVVVGLLLVEGYVEYELNKGFSILSENDAI